MSHRGMFTGLCYVCGVVCGYTYCRECKWCAQHLGMPYRRDSLLQPEAPTHDDVELLLNHLDERNERITRLERRIDAWRKGSQKAA